MAEENGLGDDLNTNKEALKRNSTESIPPTDNSNGKQNSGRSKGEEESRNTVPFYKVFTFADPIDVALMIIGTVAAIANGAALPLMTFLYGRMFNAFEKTTNTHDLVENISENIGDGKGTVKALLDRIAKLESEAEKSLMHRSIVLWD